MLILFLLFVVITIFAIGKIFEDGRVTASWLIFTFFFFGSVLTYQRSISDYRGEVRVKGYLHQSNNSILLWVDIVSGSFPEAQKISEDGKRANLYYSNSHRAAERFARGEKVYVYKNGYETKKRTKTYFYLFLFGTVISGVIFFKGAFFDR